MIGDKLIFLPEHSKKANYILPKLLKAVDKKGRLVLGVAGQSGTGKSEISHIIQELLFKSEYSSYIISIDDYYKTHWDKRNDIRKKTGVIGKDEINWKKLTRVIHDYRGKKRKLYVQRIHKYINSIEHCICPGKNIDILIIEGLYAGFCDCDFKAYLGGQASDTYKFRKLRMKENPDSKFRLQVLAKESSCVRQSKPMCDIIVPFEL